MDNYLFFSGATDKTGRALAEQLKCKSGDKLPAAKVDLLISWGAKTEKEVDIKSKATHFLNHPNSIKKNRNKFEALKVMAADKVSVAKFVSAEKINSALNSGELHLPIIGRTNFHQGGKGFWLCMARHHVVNAVEQGAQYFQEYVPITTEYRLHIFKEEVFYAAVKTEADNPQQSFIDEYTEKIKDTANKNKTKIDDATLAYALKNMAERKQHSNPVLKSHANGYKFKKVADKDLGTKSIKDLIVQSNKALKALGLDFGAVDCGVAEDGKVYIIEVNSAPGLEGTALEKWVKMFSDYIKSLDKHVEVKPKTTATKAEGTAKVMTGLKGGSLKQRAIEQTVLLRRLLENTDEAGAEKIMEAAGKAFNNFGQDDEDTEAKVAKKMFRD